MCASSSAGRGIGELKIGRSLMALVCQPVFQGQQVGDLRRHPLVTQSLVDRTVQNAWVNPTFAHDERIAAKDIERFRPAAGEPAFGGNGESLLGPASGFHADTPSS